MKSRIFQALAAASLVLLFLFPLWRITLEAPQYPEGISMYIWVNKITGDTPSTLQNINILNHYIGMKFIEPDSIPELTYFPYIAIGMIVLALLGVLINKKQYYLAWTVLMLVLAGLGIYDFYLWEYDYGHNLSPEAPIKIPGMVYQPPLIGSKMLLNFNAISMPHVGGYALGASVFFGALAFVLFKKK